MRREAKFIMAILVMCLLAGSLTALPVFSMTGPTTHLILQSEFENYEFFEQGEIEEEFFIIKKITGTTIALLNSSKLGARNLGCRTAYFEAISPPPKPA